MKDLGYFIFGVVILAAVLCLTAAIATVAPYIAGLIVLIGLIWILVKAAPDGPPEAPLS